MLNFRRIIKRFSDYCPHGRCNLETCIEQFSTKFNDTCTCDRTEMLAGDKDFSMESYFQETEERYRFLNMENL